MPRKSTFGFKESFIPPPENLQQLPESKVRAAAFLTEMRRAARLNELPAIEIPGIDGSKMTKVAFDLTKAMNRDYSHDPDLVAALIDVLTGTRRSLGGCFEGRAEVRYGLPSGQIATQHDLVVLQVMARHGISSESSMEVSPQVVENIVPQVRKARIKYGIQ